MTPMQDITTSKEPSSNGRSSASAGTHSMSSPWASGRRGPGLEQRRGEVGGDDLGAALGGWDRRVARSGGDVEDADAGGDRAGLGEALPDGQQERVDHERIVAGRPHHPVARLEVRNCGGNGLCRHVTRLPSAAARHIGSSPYLVPITPASDRCPASASWRPARRSPRRAQRARPSPDGCRGGPRNPITAGPIRNAA